MATPRTTITALGGLEKHTATLDARSAVALEFITHWCRRRTNLRPVPAAVIRRALVLLAEHLSGLDEELQAGECRAFEQAGRGSGTARTLTEARARIETHRECPARQPMDDWRDALYSIEERAEMRRTLAALEKHLGAAR